jgi:uncharacterized protein YbjT (DUF2867 family)
VPTTFSLTPHTALVIEGQNLSDQLFLNAGVIGGATVYLTKPTTAVPEPGAFGLMAPGLSGLWLARRKKG